MPKVRCQRPRCQAKKCANCPLHVPHLPRLSALEDFAQRAGLGLSCKAADALATSHLMKVDGFRLPHISMAEHTLGYAMESQQALDEAIAHHKEAFSYPIALACAWRGEKDQALEWLERAYAQRDISLWVIKVDSLLASLTSLLSRLRLEVPKRLRKDRVRSLSRAL